VSAPGDVTLGEVYRMFVTLRDELRTDFQMLVERLERNETKYIARAEYEEIKTRVTSLESDRSKLVWTLISAIMALVVTVTAGVTITLYNR